MSNLDLLFISNDASELLTTSVRNSVSAYDFLKSSLQKKKKIDVQFFIAIIEYSMTIVFSWVQTCLVLV